MLHKILTMVTAQAMVGQPMVTLGRLGTKEMDCIMQTVRGATVVMRLELAGSVHTSSTRHLRFRTPHGKATTKQSLPAVRSLLESTITARVQALYSLRWPNFLINRFQLELLTRKVSWRQVPLTSSESTNGELFKTQLHAMTQQSLAKNSILSKSLISMAGPMYTKILVEVI